MCTKPTTALSLWPPTAGISPQSTHYPQCITPNISPHTCSQLSLPVSLLSPSPLTLRFPVQVSSSAVPLLAAAAFSAHNAIVLALLEHGFDVHEANDSALAVAANRGHLSTVTLLVENGADVRSRYYWPVYEACATGRVDLMRALCESETGADYVQTHGGLALIVVSKMCESDLEEEEGEGEGGVRSPLCGKRADVPAVETGTAKEGEEEEGEMGGKPSKEKSPPAGEVEEVGCGKGRETTLQDTPHAEETGKESTGLSGDSNKGEEEEACGKGREKPDNAHADETGKEPSGLGGDNNTNKNKRSEGGGLLCYGAPARRNHAAIMRYLLECGADPRAQHDFALNAALIQGHTR